MVTTNPSPGQATNLIIEAIKEIYDPNPHRFDDNVVKWRVFAGYLRTLGHD